MGSIQGYQEIQTMNNGIYESADGNCSSSYVSSSGIKSVLLNTWSAVKSAISDMLSSFGLHLSGQQDSGREIKLKMYAAGENNHEKLDYYRGGNRETESSEVDNPVNHVYEDLDDYRVSDYITDSENMMPVGEDIYAEPHDSLKAGSRVGSEVEQENIYSEPYKPGNTISAPENNLQGRK